MFCLIPFKVFPFLFFFFLRAPALSEHCLRTILPDVCAKHSARRVRLVHNNTSASDGDPLSSLVYLDFEITSLVAVPRREAENLGSAVILVEPADSCCTTWAESRPLSCGL